MATQAGWTAGHTSVLLGRASDLLAGLGPVLFAYRLREASGCCCAALESTVASGAPLHAAIAITPDAVIEELHCTSARGALRIVRLAASDFLGWERAVEALGGYQAPEPFTVASRAQRAPRERRASYPWRATVARLVSDGYGRCRVHEDFAVAEAWRVLDALERG